MYVLIASRKRSVMIAAFVALVLSSQSFGHCTSPSTTGKQDAYVWSVGVGRLNESGNDLDCDDDIHDLHDAWKSMAGQRTEDRRQRSAVRLGGGLGNCLGRHFHVTPDLCSVCADFWLLTSDL